MRCIFCKGDSSLSRSVEHIVPESLGNETHTLPPGIVCDECNNYFARKVEKPFFDTPYITQLRFHEVLRNKRGRVPPLEGIISPGVPVYVERDPENRAFRVDVPNGAVDAISRLKTGSLFLPFTSCPPTGSVLSRFLAKVAIESLAQRFLDEAVLMDELIDHSQLDAIRSHARRGTTPDWPTSSRRITGILPSYQNALDENGDVIHESDFLLTDESEYYFVLSLFGWETAINLGGPGMDGYRKWLDQHEDKSPLYCGRNAIPR